MTNGQPKNIGKTVKVETLDFNDPNRPLSCLEVDFPLSKINDLSNLEGNAGKPVYQMSKWWARRRSSVFRSMLIAAATKAPEDKTEAAQKVWDVYYANHQKAGNFKNLKVMDIFMGGGTTLVEGARLGFDVYGNDLNPVAWFVTKNELTPVDPKEVEKAFNQIEEEVKPQILPFYTTTCPTGHKGVWTNKKTGEKMSESFDPINLPYDERKNYTYYGPEIIYTFWGKHGHCIDEKCQHRTPIFSSYVIAKKDLSVKYQEIECPDCKNKIHFEQQEVRIAPGAKFLVDETETLFIPASKKTEYNCPECNYKLSLYPNDCKKSKKVNLTLLISPEWLKGSAGIDEDGILGGYVDAPVDKTEKWLNDRIKNLEVIEYRGKLPDKIKNPFNQDEYFEIENATVPKKATFACGACGKQQTPLEATRKLGTTAPVFPYTLQCHCPICEKEGKSYSGRFFKSLDETDIRKILLAEIEWNARKENDLNAYFPKEKLPYAWMTHHLNGGIPNWGYSHWYKMFNSRQLMIHSELLKAIRNYNFSDNKINQHIMGGFQQYLRNQNMFCFWDIGYDKLVPMLSNNNFHPKINVIENNFNNELGRGNWESVRSNILKGINWINNPYELYKDVTVSNISQKLLIDDPLSDKSENVTCKSSTDLSNYNDKEFDLIITDPPFGDNIFYADLADFFYSWLKIPLSKSYPDIFNSEFTPKSQEAISNKAEHPDTRTKEQKDSGEPHPADEFYQNTLTACFAEANRLLKDGGVMAFTFHHDKDEAWIGVLESIFNAGFYLEATYPIRSDETKGENAAFGSRKIEYDIIHVCRKRLQEPEPVSWVKMRRWVKSEVEQQKQITELYRQQNISEADIRVISRGKCLEFYSKHYGKVYTSENQVLSVKDALLGINQILDDEHSEGRILPPNSAEPITRLFLQLSLEKSEIPRDELHKALRSTGVSQKDIESLGWIKEERKIIYKIPIEERFAEITKSGHRRDYIKKDLDQVYFLLGAAMDKTNKININDELMNGKFNPVKAVDDILEWIIQTDSDLSIKKAAEICIKLLSGWRSKKVSIVKDNSLQLSLLLDN
jgi:putative DNA methylase